MHSEKQNLHYRTLLRYNSIIILSYIENRNYFTVLYKNNNKYTQTINF